MRVRSVVMWLVLLVATVMTTSTALGVGPLGSGGVRDGGHEPSAAVSTTDGSVALLAPSDRVERSLVRWPGPAAVAILVASVGMALTARSTSVVGRGPARGSTPARSGAPARAPPSLA